MKRLLSFAALLAIVVIGISVLNRPGDEETTVQGTPPQPGWYLQHAVMIETNASGTPRVKISASDIKQDARADTIDMKNVQVDYFGAAPRHWLLTAQYGFIPERTQIVEFAGDVEITEVGVPDTPRIETERLTLDMEKDLAHTDAEVSVNFGPHAVNARGLRADLNAENLRLESSVNGRFQPK